MIKKRPFKALIYDDTNYAYSRNRAAGMSYLNRFIIEEDTQFECVGVAEFRQLKVSEVSKYLKKTFESHFDQFSNKSNSDFIGHFILSGESLFSSDLMQVFEDISHMITQIGNENYEVFFHKRIIAVSTGSIKLKPAFITRQACSDYENIENQSKNLISERILILVSQIDFETFEEKQYFENKARKKSVTKNELLEIHSDLEQMLVVNENS